MKRISYLNLLSVIIPLALLTGCADQDKSSDPDIQQPLFETRNDSLFLGYYFGMTVDDFFEHSWDLNKQGILLNGSGAEIIRYIEDLKAPAKMSFYPKFKDQRIYEMPIVYSYNGWAPWNDHLFSDSLQHDLVTFFQDSMDVKFTEIRRETDDTMVFRQSKRNKEIIISVVDESKVMVTFSDLSRLEN